MTIKNYHLKIHVSQLSYRLKMNKFFISCLITMSACCTAAAVETQDIHSDALSEIVEEIQDEAAQVDALIDATKASLKQLEQLKKHLKEFKALEKSCMKSPNDGKLLYKLAQAGQAVYVDIQEAELTDYFREEFVAELEKLNTLAGKKTIPPAR